MTQILFQTGRFPPNAPIWTSLWKLYRDEGFQGLFRGNSASVARIMPYSGIHFGAFEYYRRLIMEVEARHGLKLPSIADGFAGTYRLRHNSTPIFRSHARIITLVVSVRCAYFHTGSAAGLTAVITTYPLDVVRARLALHVEDKSTSPGSGNALASQARPIKGLRRMLMHTMQAEGLPGLYRGITPTLVGIIPYSGIKFFVYQGLKRAYVRYVDMRTDVQTGKRTLPVHAMLLCGGAAGVVAQTATYPLDVVRRRMQVRAHKIPAQNFQTFSSKSQLPPSLIYAILYTYTDARFALGVVVCPAVRVHAARTAHIMAETGHSVPLRWRYHQLRQSRALYGDRIHHVRPY